MLLRRCMFHLLILREGSLSPLFGTPVWFTVSDFPLESRVLVLVILR
jgi:hypothetical protein